MLHARRAGLLCGLLLVAVGRSAASADRVGSESCKSCHAVAFELWQASGHAHASQSLPSPQQVDPRCTHCHAPEVARWSQESAAFLGSNRAPPPAEPGVTCESCHGPGQFYSPSYVMRDAEVARAVGLVDPGQKSCLVCHTADAPALIPFDFAAKVKLIDHWSRAAAGGASTTEPPPPSAESASRGPLP